VVRVASYTAGARRAVSTLFGGRKRNGRETGKKEA